MTSLLVKLSEALDGAIHIEREKRLTLSEAPEEIKGIEPAIIKQGILRETKKGDNVIAYARIRMKQEPGEDPKYSLGVKHFPRKEEAETEISKQMFDAFYPDNLSKPQSKKRYHLKSGWDIDVIDGGGIVAEYEHEKGDKIEVPDHWMVKKAEDDKLSIHNVPHPMLHSVSHKIVHSKLMKSMLKKIAADDLVSVISNKVRARQAEKKQFSGGRAPRQPSSSALGALVALSKLKK